MFRSLLRPVAALAALSGLAAYATIMLRGPQGLNALADKHRQIRVLQEKIDRLEYLNKQERIRLERLKHDPTAQVVELEKSGYVAPDSTVFKTTDPSMRPGFIGAKP